VPSPPPPADLVLNGVRCRTRGRSWPRPFSSLLLPLPQLVHALLCRLGLPRTQLALEPHRRIHHLPRPTHQTRPLGNHLGSSMRGVRAEWELQPPSARSCCSSDEEGSARPCCSSDEEGSAVGPAPREGARHLQGHADGGACAASASSRTAAPRARLRRVPSRAPRSFRGVPLLPSPSAVSAPPAPGWVALAVAFPAAVALAVELEMMGTHLGPLRELHHHLRLLHPHQATARESQSAGSVSAGCSGCTWSTCAARRGRVGTTAPTPLKAVQLRHGAYPLLLPLTHEQ